LQKDGAGIILFGKGAGAADLVSAFDDLHPRDRYQYQEIETV
jgi:hypothetical protein